MKRAGSSIRRTCALGGGPTQSASPAYGRACALHSEHESAPDLVRRVRNGSRPAARDKQHRSVAAAGAQTARERERRTLARGRLRSVGNALLFGHRVTHETAEVKLHAGLIALGPGVV